MHATRVPPFAETRDYVRLVQQVYALYRPDAQAAQPARIRISRVRAIGPAMENAN